MPHCLFFLCPTLAIPWTAAHQAPLSMGFSRQDYWSGWPFPFLGNLPDPGIEPGSPALQAGSLPTELPGKEQYCIGAWNVRSMNQGKLEVIKQEMARVNVDILGISKLKRTGMGEFHSDDHYIYYCRQESLRRNGEAIMVNKRV